MNPARVSPPPNDAATSGASVLAGSDATPQAATMKSSAASSGRARTDRRASTKLTRPPRRSWGPGCTPLSTTHSTKNDRALMPNAHVAPRLATRAAPPTGPRARARLTATESRFTARPRLAGGDELGDHGPEGGQGEGAADAHQRGGHDHHRRGGQAGGRQDREYRR